MSNKVELAKALAKWAHEGQKYGEHDYFEYHVMGVAFKINCDGCTEDLYITALLHDVVEDSHVDLGTIKNLFGDNVCRSVNMLTRRNEMSYEDYISHIVISKDELILSVKIAELQFHLSQPEIRHENRYRAALKQLQEAL